MRLLGLFGAVSLLSCGGATPAPQRQPTPAPQSPAHSTHSGTDHHDHGPAVEIMEGDVPAVAMPAVPALKAPAANPDGTLSSHLLRVDGARYIGKDVRVKGVVVWRYDCRKQLSKPGVSQKEVSRLLREEPERCQRPNFFLGGSSADKPGRGIWVVEVPRPPRDDEKKALPKEALSQWPRVPTFNVGDHVVVEGRWSKQSPMGFRNSDGLLIYRTMRSAK